MSLKHSSSSPSLNVSCFRSSPHSHHAVHLSYCHLFPAHAQTESIALWVEQICTQNWLLVLLYFPLRFHLPHSHSPLLSPQNCPLPSLHPYVCMHQYIHFPLLLWRLITCNYFYLAIDKSTKVLIFYPYFLTSFLMQK